MIVAEMESEARHEDVGSYLHRHPSGDGWSMVIRLVTD